ncbi:MAG: hypothetical protein QME78_03985 [Thermodesulfobacteriota bacterium]|nr:hypothetical protein [Thermodesulfobacteriota bacterium]
MFYPVQIPEPKPGEKQISALVVLNPSESRRLVAKATVALAEVQNAMKNGMIIIGRGITNAYVTEELLKTTIEPKAGQTVGLIGNGFANVHAGPPPCTWHVVRKGKVVEGADSNVEILNFGPEDVFIKGANAIDTQGNAGVWVSGVKAGTIGMCWPIVTARGSHLIQPVGLEKLVPSVLEASWHSGLYHYKYSMGLPGKIVPLTSSKVVTEIQAFALLAGVRAYHITSGGVGGSEGAVVLSLEGEEEKVKKAFDLAKSVKGEPAVTMPDKYKVSSPADYKYDAMAQLGTLGGL